MESSPFLIVGLGNPGDSYTNTPHNVGFEVVDRLAARWNCAPFRKKFDGLWCEADVHGRKVLLLKPQTFMNLSGKSIAGFVNFFKVPVVDSLLVVVDDLDLPPGQLRLRKAGGTGGHNGLRSTVECLGVDTFPRLRIGIGRSPGADASSHVLGKIPKALKDTYESAFTKTVEGIEFLLKQGVDIAMNQINRGIDANGA